MLSVRWIGLLLFSLCSAVWAAEPVHPAAVVTSFRSGDVDIPAFLQRPASGDTRGVLINLQGNPGGKIRAESPLATVLAKQGIATFWFNYRGIWGNKGTYSLSSAVGDFKAAIAFLDKGETRKQFGLGDAPLLAMGYSFGGAVALMGGATHDRITGLVAMAPCDHSYFANAMVQPQAPAGYKKVIEDSAEAVFGPKGPVPGGMAAFADDLIAGGRNWAFVPLAPALQNKALLFLVPLDDTICPVEDHFLPLYRALRQAKHPRLTIHAFNSGHGFDGTPIAQRAQLVAEWAAGVVASRAEK